MFNLNLVKSMNKFYLEPINGRESFYNKALVIDQNGISKLQSYDIIVAEYNHETNTMSVYGYYSATTLSHINAFLNYYGFETCTKKELINKYNL